MTISSRSRVQRVLMFTLVFNVLVAALKAAMGWWTGSLSLLAEALHSVTDVSSNLLALVTHQLAAPEPDRDHPYGHQKFEAVGTLGIAVFLGIACFEIFQGAVERITNHSQTVSIPLGVLGGMLLIVGGYTAVSLLERRVGERLKSPLLLADARHNLSDLWVTIVVIAGLIGVHLGYPWIDAWLAFPVGLLVFWSGWEVVESSLPWLVDQMAIAPEAIYALAMGVPGVLNCHEIASRGIVGRQVFVEMHLIVVPTDVPSAHEITEQVEALIEEQYGPARVIIHVEPPDYISEQISFGDS